MICQLTCKFCGELIQSELVIKDKAVQECADRLALHIEKVHIVEHANAVKAMQSDLMKVFAGLCLYHTVTNFSSYEDDEIIRDRIEKVQEDLMEFIGFESDPENENEEENSTENTSVSSDIPEPPVSA